MKNSDNKMTSPIDMLDFRPGEWSTFGGSPSITWWRYGAASKGEPNFVEHVQKYATDADRIAAYQAFVNRDSSERGMAPVDQAALAEKAFAEYEFGDGVMVTDLSGWEYMAPGNERTRKVYVETEPEDGGRAPRGSWTLNFTVRFDPETGLVNEAYALDHRGQIWGALPALAGADLSAESPGGQVETEEVTKITHFLERSDGSEVRIIAQACFGAGLHRSVDVMVHKRESSNHEWALCSSSPALGWRSMSVADYILHGRSPALQAASPGEILRAVSAIGRPIAEFSTGEVVEATLDQGAHREGYPAPRM